MHCLEIQLKKNEIWGDGNIMSQPYMYIQMKLVFRMQKLIKT